MEHDGERTEPAGTWWRRQLAGLDAGLELPADPRSPGGVPRLERLSLPVGGPDGCLGPLDLVAARPSAEVDATVLLAGVAALCARLTGCSELPLGTAVPGTEGRPGLAVLRFRLAAGTPFGDLVAQARDLLAEATRRGPVPPALARGHDPRRHPLTQVVVVVRARGDSAPDTAALRLVPQAPPFDLAWILDRTAEPAALLLELDASRFRSAGHAWMNGLQSLLSAGLGDPALPVGALPAGALRSPG